MSGRILAVDDTERCAAIVACLRACGYEVRIAGCTTDALARIDDDPPEVVIVDASFPDAAEACRLLAQGDAGLKDRATAPLRPPVLVACAGPDDERVVACLEAGAADVIVHNEHPRIVAARVGGLVARWRLHKTASLNEQLAMLGRVVGGVLHEIRSPLTVVVAGVELLAGKLDNSDAERWIEPVLRNARLLRSLCEQLLEGFREPSRERVPVELNPLLVQASEFALKGHPEGQRIRCVLELEEGLPCVAGHPGKLLHVLLNLIVNARESILGARTGGTPAPPNTGLGTITLRSRTVGAEDGDAEGAGQNVEIEVQDDGPGIPPALRGRIFEPFFTTKAAGIGFGLALARDLLAESSGTLAAEDAPEGGALFRIRLPVNAEPLAGAEAARPA